MAAPRKTQFLSMTMSSGTPRTNTLDLTDLRLVAVVTDNTSTGLSGMVIEISYDNSTWFESPVSWPGNSQPWVLVRDTLPSLEDVYLRLAYPGGGNSGTTRTGYVQVEDF